LLPILHLRFGRHLNLGRLDGFAVAGSVTSEQSSLRLFVHLLGQLTVGVGEVEERLNDLRGEDLILLPQVENADHFALKTSIKKFITIPIGNPIKEI